jgi:hypothetical protein
MKSDLSVGCLARWEDEHPLTRQTSCGKQAWTIFLCHVKGRNLSLLLTDHLSPDGEDFSHFQ